MASDLALKLIQARPIVVVRWNDAQSSATHVYTADDPTYHHPIVMSTLGWVLRDDDIGISVVNETFLDNGVANFRGHTFVPRALVIDVTTVRGANRAKPRRREAVPTADVRSVNGPDREERP